MDIANNRVAMWLKIQIMQSWHLSEIGEKEIFLLFKHFFQFFTDNKIISNLKMAAAADGSR